MKLKKLSKLLSLSIIAVSLGVSGMIAHAETSQTTSTPQIATNQGLSSDSGGGASGATSSGGSSSSDGAGIANAVRDNANSEANRLGESFTENNRNYRKKVASDTGSVINNITKQVRDSATQAAGENTSYSGLSISDVRGRADKVLDDLGTGGIGLLVKGLYYLGFGSIIVGLIMTVISLFVKGMKTLKWVGTAVFGLLIYGLITQALGISLMDNPLSEIVGFILHG